MAEITPTVVKVADGVVRVTWADLANGDTGRPVQCAGTPDKSVQLTGTLSTNGQCDIEGSNDESTYAILNDVGGSALSLVALGIKTVLENTVEIRPNISNGDGSTDLTVNLLMKM